MSGACVLLAAPFSLPDPGPNPVSLLLLLAGMSLLPFLMVMFTSFTKISVVLSLTRSALGTQQAPPTVVLTGLSAVLSLVVMSPVAEAMVARVHGERLPAAPGPEMLRVLRSAAEPLRAFLVEHGSPELRAEFAALSHELRGGPEVSESDLMVVAPAFVLSELKQAFQIGFLIFLPFLVVDMVVANVLLALGMQSLSPSQVSLPFKVLLFVAVDGWALLARSLVQGYRS
ncbi:MAG TPA: type III secretion system export apparatus subunit SctR [Myxococcaceae bacterium]|nr:type III secretion system export apparatus subunit SctR [Myxococcaceae bacterium]